MVVVAGVNLSSVYVVSDEFLKDVRNGGVVDDFVCEGDDINGVDSLCEVYYYECCAMRWSFLVESVYDWVSDGEKGCGGGMFSLGTMLVCALR